MKFHTINDSYIQKNEEHSEYEEFVYNEHGDIINCHENLSECIHLKRINFLLELYQKYFISLDHATENTSSKLTFIDIFDELCSVDNYNFVQMINDFEHIKRTHMHQISRSSNTVIIPCSNPDKCICSSRVEEEEKENINDKYFGFAFSTSLYMMIFDTILYVLFTLYFDQIIPSRFGQTKSPFFIFFPSFWYSSKTHKSFKDNIININEINNSKNFEKYNQSIISPVIMIRNLKKYFYSSIFGGGDTVKAVDNISLDLYSGQIFCLLGHNGAGKTTTISMLTGLLDTTDGNALILGNYISDGMKQIRKSIGICPQHDVLFDRLTVREHLELFCKLKGVSSKLIESQVNKTLKDIDLIEKEHSFPCNMSGGQRRKLSLGIAFIGGSKIVFLDEPTSGMDPASRRITWEFIQKQKRNRCIVLTTHFMDEADILSDKIGIMCNGRLQCYGSSLFLKRLYGVGYTFTISLNIGTNTYEIKQLIDNLVLNKKK
eukprot:335847_1